MKTASKKFISSPTRTENYINEINNFVTKLSEFSNSPNINNVKNPYCGVIKNNFNYKEVKIKDISIKENNLNKDEIFKPIALSTANQKMCQKQILSDFLCSYIFEKNSCDEEPQNSNSESYKGELITKIDIAMTILDVKISKSNIIQSLLKKNLISSPNFLISLEDASNNKPFNYFAEVFLMDKFNISYPENEPIKFKILEKILLNENTPRDPEFLLQTRQPYCDGIYSFEFGGYNNNGSLTRAMDIKIGNPKATNISQIYPIKYSSNGYFDGILNDPIHSDYFFQKKIEKYDLLLKNHKSINHYIDSDLQNCITNCKTILLSSNIKLITKINIINYTDMNILNIIKSKGLNLYYNPQFLMIWGQSLKNYDLRLGDKNPLLNNENAFHSMDSFHKGSIWHINPNIIYYINHDHILH